MSGAVVHMTEYICSNCFPQKSIPKNINKSAALGHVGENAVDVQDGGSCHNKPVRLQETSSRTATAPLLLQETRLITDHKGVCLNRAHLWWICSGQVPFLQRKKQFPSGKWIHSRHIKTLSKNTDVTQVWWFSRFWRPVMFCKSAPPSITRSRCSQQATSRQSVVRASSTLQTDLCINRQCFKTQRKTEILGEKEKRSRRFGQKSHFYYFIAAGWAPHRTMCYMMIWATQPLQFLHAACFSKICLPDFILLPLFVLH